MNIGEKEKESIEAGKTQRERRGPEVRKMMRREAVKMRKIPNEGKRHN